MKVRHIAGWLLFGLTPSLLAGDIRLNARTTVSFADVETARHLLTNRDDYVAALSPFDRAARMKTGRDVSEREFLEFIGSNVLPWQPDETNRVTGVLEVVAKKLSSWNLPFPPVVLFIKTTGREEGDAEYTRQNAVVLPQHALTSVNLERIILHELFHVLSRQNPALRTQSYAIIHFHPINAVPLPAELQPRKITNPDGVQNGWAIEVTNEDRVQTVIPVLYARVPRYDPEKGGEFFDYLTFKLLAVTNNGRQWVPELAEGQPHLIDPRDAGGYLDKVGRNTQYLIHPDEILADNFVLLVEGSTNLPTPGVVSDLARVLEAR